MTKPRKRIKYIPEKYWPFCLQSYSIANLISTGKMLEAQKEIERLELVARESGDRFYELEMDRVIIALHYAKIETQEALEKNIALAHDLQEHFQDNLESPLYLFYAYMVETMYALLYTRTNNITLKYYANSKALRLAEALDYPRAILTEKTNLAGYFGHLGDHQKSNEALFATEALHYEVDNANLNLLYHNIAVNYDEQEQYEKANEFFAKSLPLSLEKEMYYIYLHTLSTYARSLVKQARSKPAKIHEALETLEKAEDFISAQFDEEALTANNYFILAYAWCYYYKFVNEAPKIIDLLEGMIEHCSNANKLDLLPFLSWAYVETDKKQQAHQVFENYVNINKQLYVKNPEAGQAKLDAIYKAAKSEAEIAYHQQLYQTEQVHKQAILFEKNQVELGSLVRQMNPHFMFNALNSIGNFVQSNEAKIANKYIARYAKLMRLTLEHSQKERICLEDEVEMINLYLDLESLRFGHLFSSEVLIEDIDNLYNYSIPPMLIQPNVENAIWHGLRRRKQKEGKLVIQFRIEDEYLHCSIVDNGIGREHASAFNKVHRKHHQSVGKLNLERRLEIINQMQDRPILFEISDNQKEDLENPGTKVQLAIPI